MGLSEFRARAEAYCKARQEHEPDVTISSELGKGQDGYVWKTTVASAVKVFGHSENYAVERDCYQRLEEREVFKIDGVSIPRLVGFDDQLMVIEIDIVAPPYLLDFGKAYIDRRAPYDEEQLAEYYEVLKERFGDDYPRVRKIMRALWRDCQIDYIDAKPDNICFHIVASD